MGLSNPGAGGYAEFAVSLPELMAAYDDLRDFRKFLVDQIESAQQTVMRLGSDWSGDAHDALVEFFAKLSQGMAKVDAGLAVFADSIDHAHGQYQKAISVNLSMWHGE